MLDHFLQLVIPAVVKVRPGAGDVAERRRLKGMMIGVIFGELKSPQILRGFFRERRTCGTARAQTEVVILLVGEVRAAVASGTAGAFAEEEVSATAGCGTQRILSRGRLHFG